MQNSTRMDKVIIKDQNYMTTINENMNWMKATDLLSVCL